MTTTSVFQGIQEGSKLSSRVLKPPGGVSSISFMDDANANKSSGEPSPQKLTPKSSGIIHQEISPLPKNDSATSTPITDTKNGMEPGMIVGSGNGSFLKENIPPLMSEKDCESLLNISLNGCNINKNIISGSETQSPNTSDSKSDTKPKPLLDELPNLKPVNGVNGVHENGSNVLNGNSSHVKIDSSDLSPTKVSSPLLQNGLSSPANLSTSNSSLVASPSMKPNQDTKERVIGHTDEIVSPQPSQQPRKIKDHMRSSIIMSDEDYTPTRSSRFNATVNNTPPENLPSAGQRQRIPPGGFSSKLW